jgi:hypothetical protein
MKSRDPRMAVNVPARMRIDSDWVDVSIRNLSARGLMAKTNANVAQRTYVELHRGDQIIVGRIVWTRDGHFGLRAQDRIDMIGLIGRAQQAGGGRRCPGDPTRPERRTKPREQSSQGSAWTAHRSRRQANLFQFVTIGIVALSGSAAAAVAVARLLQDAFTPVMLVLGQ